MTEQTQPDDAAATARSTTAGTGTGTGSTAADRGAADLAEEQRQPRHADALATVGQADVTVEVDRIPVDDTYVRVSSIGEPGGRAFVLVAGLGIAATYYERLAPNLNDFGPVHALDLPGFAGVRKFHGKVSIERYADALERVLDVLDLDDPVLVGHSMGTQVVTEVAARRPDLSHVVLISPVVDAGARSISESAVRFLRSAWHEPAAIRWHAVTAYALCGWHWFRRVLPQMVGFPVERRAADVQARVLVVRGEHDALVPRDWLRRLARVLPYAVLREVVGGAHSVMHAQADAVSRLAVAHVKGELPDRGVASLQRVRDTTTADDLSRLSWSDAWLVLKARFLELVGMAKSDDELLERGKSAHAVAMADQDGAEVDPGERERVERALHAPADQDVLGDGPDDVAARQQQEQQQEQEQHRRAG